MLALELLISTSTKSSPSSTNSVTTSATPTSEDKSSRRSMRKKNPFRKSNESELLPLKGEDDERNYQGIGV